MLLDNLIRLASQYYIDEKFEDYYRTLECWYMETFHRFEKSKKTKDLYPKLVELRKNAMISKIDSLKEYHMMLNKCTHAEGLRMSDVSNLPGVVQP